MTLPSAASPSQLPASTAAGPLARRVQAILASKGLTLYRAAALIRVLHPREKDFQIRPNFYFQLRSGLSPTFQQIFALSQITGYRLRDWLAVFGFRLDAIPRLQAVLLRPRTGRIDHGLVDDRGVPPSLRYRRRKAHPAAVAPLGQWLEVSPEGSAVPKGRADFLYAKIGFRDSLAAPELLPGSIVRADPRLTDVLFPKVVGEISRHFFLVEHGRGLTCTRLALAAPNRFSFVTAESPSSALTFELGTEAAVLGVVDLEFRFPLAWRKQRAKAGTEPGAVREFAGDAKLPPLAIASDRLRPGALLRRFRLRAGLSFRCASKLSRKLAEAMGDTRYFASGGALSDYEAGERLPRHIHKLFTLAILYSVPFRELLGSFGIVWDDGRKVALPEEWHGAGSAITEERAGEEDGFWEGLLGQFGDLPLFFREALPALTEMRQISLRDVFWAGGQATALHPALREALFLIVNRRPKKPQFSPRLPFWKQPLYVLQTRDGSYLCGSADSEKGHLTLVECSGDFNHLQAERRTVDADVVGQIVGIVRSLLSPP